jgi:hypothetical protein
MAIIPQDWCAFIDRLGTILLSRVPYRGESILKVEGDVAALAFPASADVF